MALPTLAIFCGSWNMYGLPWDLESEGLGGAEEAVLYMSQELAKYYDVTVFGWPPALSFSASPKFNPRLVHVRTLSRQMRFDFVIVWRDVSALSWVHEISSCSFFWSHDSPSPGEAKRLQDALVTQTVVAIFLSKFHASAWGIKKRIFFSSNGIVTKQFAQYDHEESRVPFRFIYASNYGQGLLGVLEIWEKLREKFPLVRLDIYGGWGHFPVKDKPQIQGWITKLATKGVQEYGRITHEQLAKEMSCSDYWIYPATVHETFCITAIKAQAAGCIPVVVQTAGLLETVVGGYTCANQSEFMNLLIKACSNQNKHQKIREHIKSTVRARWDWSVVAASWHAFFSTPH